LLLQISTLLIHHVLPVTLSLLSPLALPFPAHTLETSTAPLLALGNEKAFLLHIAQNPIPDHLFTKAPEQALL
jgi:hypothetical protein